MKTDRICNRIAAWMGIFNISWGTDFPDDGYTDLRGRAPVDEPFWISDLEPAESPKRTIRVIRPDRPARHA